MIYQPINVWPSVKAIDAQRDNTFSVEINTSGSVVAYQLTILDWNNNIVLQDSRVELEEPLYNGDVLYFNPNITSLINGNDYKWRLRLFQTDDTMVITTGFVVAVSDTEVTITKNVNIKANMYMQVGTETKLITAVNINEGHMKIVLESAFSVDISDETFTILSSFIDTNPDYVLYTRTTPNIAITNFANEINVRNYTFQGSYQQQENIPITWYQWNLYIVQNNVRRLIYDTGKVYRADIIFPYDGYLTGSQYQIELIIMNEANVTVQTGIKSFSVFYETVDFLTVPQLFLDCKKHAIRINWTTPISFDPTMMNVSNSFVGNVKDLNGNTMQLPTGLDIQIGSVIIFNAKYQNVVSVYDPESGFTAFKYSVETDITNGTPFIILNYVGNIGSIDLLRDTPYRLSNSASMLENMLVFHNPTGGYIGKTPETDNITFQFRLPMAFWSGVITKNIRLLPIVHLNTEDVNNVRGFEVFINLNKLVFIQPAIDNNQIYQVNITDIVGSHKMILDNAIDFDTQKYIRFVGYNYIAEIVDYDQATREITLFEKPPFVINAGHSISVYDTLEYNFYTLMAQFPLQDQGTKDNAVDYIWDDTKSWDDALYWFEGGGAKYRIADTWFKVRINGSIMDVRAGGI